MGVNIENLTRLLTIKEVADYFQVSTKTVYLYIKEGKLKGIKIGSEWRISQIEIENIINQIQ